MSSAAAAARAAFLSTRTISTPPPCITRAQAAVAPTNPLPTTPTFIAGLRTLPRLADGSDEALDTAGSHPYPVRTESSLVLGCAVPTSSAQAVDLPSRRRSHGESRPDR